MEKKFDWKLLLTLLIATSPILGYGLAYVYQLGYCSYFNIPTEFIKLDLTMVLVAIAGTAGVLFFLSCFILMMWSKPRNMSTIGQKIYISVVMFFFFFVFSLLYFTVNEAEQVAIMYGIFLLFIFFGPWAVHKLSSIQLGKRKSEQKTPSDDRVVQFISTKYFRYGFLGIFILAIVVYCGALAGRSDAMNKQIFYELPSDPNAVILRIYGDNVISGQLQYEQNKIGLGPIIFVSSLNNANLMLTPIKIDIQFMSVPQLIK